jgi:hypothetical protein
MEAIGQFAVGIARDFNNIPGAIVSALCTANLESAAHPAVIENQECISECQRAGDRNSQSDLDLQPANGRKSVCS